MNNFTYGSVCSGIEAATQAWHVLGWRPAWFAEIEAFPAAVLAHHYPTVPNLGDMTQIAAAIRAGAVPAPDCLVGGTPCQAFSVAGLRDSLDDARGQLTLAYVELANAIDDTRTAAGEPECIIVWENVPGVLNTKDNAFGCFLGALAGEDCALEPPGGKWPNAGCVSGPKRAIAWRVLDAQYFGVAQRRRRVFVVASAREGFDPAEVLFEFDGLRQDSPPSRQAGQETAAGTLRCTDGGSDVDHARAGHPQPVAAPVTRSVERPRGDGLDTLIAGTLQANGKAAGSATQQDAESGLLVPVAFGGNNQSGPIDVATARNACSSASGRLDFETETFLVQPAIAFDTTQITSATNRSNPRPGDPCHPLSASAHPPAIAFNARQDPDAWTERTGPLDTDGGTQAVCITGDITHTLKAEGFDASEDGTGRGQPIVACVHSDAVGRTGEAITPSPDAQGRIRLRNPGIGVISDGTSYNLMATGQPHAVSTGMAVRRLTPRECERLQGFPDFYTDVPVRGKPAADGPRYKALGNSMAVPCMRWIGQRIVQHLSNPYGDLL